MTELYINGYLSVLPTGVEFSVVEDNPFLTKSGEYTLDLELDLQDPVNAKIFGHIDRFHRKGNQDRFPAILIADSQVRMRGSALIQSRTDISIKIQLLSGNSELNYFIGADRKMEELDLGTESEITQDKALDTLHKCYPDSNYVCAPAVTESGSGINRYRQWTKPGEYSETISRTVMMPYLLYYVQKIPEALGYSITENQLTEDELLCRLYIPHSKKTLHYNEVLAGWTVQDFLIEIEKFCNTVFVIDREKSSVRIVRFYNWKNNSEKFYIDEIIDGYKTEYDSDNEIDVINYKNVKYALPADDYYKYRSLPDFVFENTEIEEYDTFQDLTAALTPLSGYYSKNRIYHVRKHVEFGFLEIEADNCYIVRKLEDNSFGLERVNEFHEVGEKDGNTIELKIIPAEMDIYVYPDYVVDIPLQAPVVPDIEEEEEEEEEKSVVIELIESGEDSSDSAGTLPVAIYMGNLNSGPWSQTDVYTSMGGERIAYPGILDLISDGISSGQLPAEEKDYLADLFRWYLKYTLRLSGENGLFNTNYSLNKGIASKETWVMRFIPKMKISPQNTFVVNNREFICISLETRFDIHGARPEVEGKFYPVD
jgi:hypothetical protein